MAHAAPRAGGGLALVVLRAAVGCALWVGIPQVKLVSDGGAGGQCARGTDGGMRAGPDMVRIDSLLGSYCIDSTGVTVSQFNAFIIATGGSLAGRPAACTAADAAISPKANMA